MSGSVIEGCHYDSVIQFLKSDILLCCKNGFFFLHMKYKYIHFNQNDTLNGIFVYLNEYYPELFEIEATTHNDVAGTSPRDITKRNRSKTEYWATAHDPEMIISFTHPILLTSYTIENAGLGHTWMMNWTLFGSNNKRNWKLIDQRKCEIFCQELPTMAGNCQDSTNLSFFINRYFP